MHYGWLYCVVYAWLMGCYSMTCPQCTGEKCGYNTHCLNCCARLVMSTGKKTGNHKRDNCISQQREMMFVAIKQSGSKIKRVDIVERIKNQG